MTASTMPTDFRMGLVVFLLLELGTYVTLAARGRVWSDHPVLSAWRSALVVISIVVLLGVVALWLAGSRSRRHGRIILLAIAWLGAVTARLVPSFVLGGPGMPVLLTLYIGQLAFGIMVPLAANDCRKKRGRESFCPGKA